MQGIIFMKKKSRILFAKIEKSKDDLVYRKLVQEYAVKKYIHETEGEFNFTDLAEMMRMTYKQLSKLLKSMKKEGVLCIQDGVFKLNPAEKKCLMSYENHSTHVKMKDTHEYIPLNFQNDFKGYT
jgi:hypothetical protein